MPNLFPCRPLIATTLTLCTAIYSSKMLHANIQSSLSYYNPPKSFFEKHFVFSNNNVRRGRNYTFITSTFNHASIVDLLLNMRALYLYGNLPWTCDWKCGHCCCICWFCLFGKTIDLEIASKDITKMLENGMDLGLRINTWVLEGVSWV